MAGRRNDTPELEGIVRDLARGGDGVVDTSRGVVFAPGVLPGEEVRLRDVAKLRGTLRSESVRVVSASPERRDPECVTQSRCGGCPWMIASPELQQATKRAFASKAAGVELELFAAEPLRYRRRARLAWDRKHRLGYREAKSRYLVTPTECLVLDPVIEAARVSLEKELVPLLTGDGEASLAIGSEGRAVVQLNALAAQSTETYARIASLVDTKVFAGIALRVEGAVASFGDPREHVPSADGAPLIGTVGGFSQANDAVNRALRAYVRELANVGGGTFLELYAGHGNLTVDLAEDASKGLAVELSEEAVKACEQNLRARGITHVACKAADASAAAKGPRVDVVVLDPPRTGAAEVLDALANERRPARIVYVSCDTATLERDRKRLETLGYRVATARAFDMFPHTAHVETVVLFERVAGTGPRR